MRLEERTVIGAPIKGCFDLASRVEVHLEGTVHFGERALATGGDTTGLIGLGERVTWRSKQMKRDHFFRAIFPGAHGDGGCVCVCGATGCMALMREIAES